MGKELKTTGKDLRAFGKLFVEYGLLLQKAGEEITETTEDGLVAIHAGLKSTRRLIFSLLGRIQMPDDSEVDAFIQTQYIDSGLNPRYSAKRGGKLTPAQIRDQVAIAKAKFVTDAAESKMAQSSVEKKAEPNRSAGSKEKQNKVPKKDPKKKA